MLILFAMVAFLARGLMPGVHQFTGDLAFEEAFSVNDLRGRHLAVWIRIRYGRSSDHKIVETLHR